MTTATQRALAKAIQNAPSQVALAEPAPLTITRGTIAAVAHVENGIAQTYVQLPGSKQNVPAEVALGYGAAVGDVVDILVAPPRLIVLGPTSNIPSGPGISSSYYASLTGPGEKVSTGGLTQTGPLTVDDGSGAGLQVLVLGTPPGPSSLPINIIDATTTSFSNPSGIQISSGEGDLVLHGTAGVNVSSGPANEVQFILDSTTGPFTFILNGAGFNLFVTNGNPNGSVVALAIGSLCVDTSTPALWIATTIHGTAWSKVGP